MKNINTITKITYKNNYYILTINGNKYPIDYYYYECILPYEKKVLEVSQMIELIAFSAACEVLKKLYNKIFNHQISTFEVKQKLLAKQIDENKINIIISFLKNEGHLKEIGFINYYKEIYQSKKGVNAFKLFLESKHISSNSINNALLEFIEDEKLAFNLVNNYIKTKVGSNKLLKQKSFIYLINKGFSTKLANKVIEQLHFDNEDESIVIECRKYIKKYPNDFKKIISKLAIKGYNVSAIKKVLKKEGMTIED